MFNKRKPKPLSDDPVILEELIQKINKDPNLKATLTTVNGTKIVLETKPVKWTKNKVNWEL